MQPDFESHLLGQVVGDYQLERVLGSGSFGYVFEAKPTSGGPLVAIKMLKPNLPTADQVDFNNEGMLLRKLISCDGVINHLGSGNHELILTLGTIPVPIPLPYQIIALASGSLNELSDDPIARSKWDLIDLLQLWRSAVKSLMRMHQSGVAHRDLKCSNALIMLGKHGQTIRFADLGRAKDVSLPSSRQPREYVVGRGDLTHAPPEALFWQGEPSADAFFAADYYGLGSMLVEMLTGSPVTAMAIGNVWAALDEGEKDYRSGRSRDLSSMLMPKYDNAISQIVDPLPKVVQEDLRHLLEVLCHPNPDLRTPQTPFSRDQRSRQKLEWVLRRVDISIRRLKIERRQQRRRERSVA